MSHGAIEKIEKGTWYRCPRCRCDYSSMASAESCYRKHLGEFRVMEVAMIVGERIEYQRNIGSDSGGPYTTPTQAIIVAVDGERWEQRALVERETGEREWIGVYRNFIDGWKCVVKKVGATCDE